MGVWLLRGYHMSMIYFNSNIDVGFFSRRHNVQLVLPVGPHLPGLSGRPLLPSPVLVAVHGRRTHEIHDQGNQDKDH